MSAMPMPRGWRFRPVNDGMNTGADVNTPSTALTVSVHACESERGSRPWRHDFADPVWRQRYFIDAEWQENARRRRMTPEVCRLVLMAYTESRWLYARQLAEGLGLYSAIRELVCSDSCPSYTDMRGWLVAECDADYFTACAAAFHRVDMQNRHDRHSLFADVARAWEGGHMSRCDRGWL